MVETFLARTGDLSLRANGVAIHSPYDPVKEAERFAAVVFPPDPPSTVILLGEGLGYATRAIEKRFPGSRIIPLYYSDEIFALGSSARSPAWHPGDGRTLMGFLREAIGELDVEGLQIAEWPPSARVFPEFSQEAQRCVRQAIQEASGSFFTTIGSGKTWLRNSLLNFISFNSILTGTLCSPESPILIAAPGPSLEEVLPRIREMREIFDVWALPSSLKALRHSGIEPDLVVMTDPGYWSISHLDFSGIQCPLAMPLSAARGAWRFPIGVFLLSQPTFFETAILVGAGLSAPQFPPHGTVTATAIDMALSCSRAPIIVAGVDLCIRDILSHARPNSFDRFLWLESDKLSPHYHLSFSRALGQPFDAVRRDEGIIRVPRSLKTYTGWLASAGSGRVFRIAPSHVDLESMPGVGIEFLRDFKRRPASFPRGPRLHADRAFPSHPRRMAVLGKILDDWTGSLARCLSSVKSTGDPTPLAGSTKLFSLAYHLEAQLLVETRRKLRVGQTAAARDTAIELLERSLSFLDSLRMKIGA